MIFTFSYLIENDFLNIEFILGRYQTALIEDTMNGINSVINKSLYDITRPLTFLFGNYGDIYDGEYLRISDSGIIGFLGYYGFPLASLFTFYFLYKNKNSTFNKKLYIFLFLISNIKGQYIFSSQIAVSWFLLINSE